ncbi:unnamed protein product [Rodentolepis nana]|uniref:40S ribosomal protein S9 n=1 Tax=Rodentolepis nana TaxID=102285 RepID=A0A0R3TR67_RODNA|nr:unnamed protein product [Rodentolepis nana]
MRRSTSDVRQRETRKSYAIEQNGTRRRNASVPFNNNKQEKTYFPQDSETDFLCDRAVEFMESGDICSIVTVELAEQSSYFERLLRYHRGRGIIRLPEFLNAGFYSVVEYIRRGSTKITPENIYDVFIAADYLLVPKLKEECASYINELANDPSAAINLWMNGRKLFWAEIGETAYQKILENFETVWKSDEFLQMESEDIESILKNDALNCKSEVSVYKAIVRWVASDLKLRAEHALKLLSNVRMGMMRNSDLEQVKSHEHLMLIPEFAQIVQNWPNSIHSLMDRLDVYQKLKLTKPRTPHEVLCVFGGWCDGEGPRAAAQIFSPCSNSWTLWTDLGCQTQCPHYEWLANLRSDGPDSPKLPEGLFQCEEKFTTSNDISCLIGEIPRRVYAGCVQVRNRVYLVGGFDGSNALKSTLCYDFEVDSGWYEISCMYEKRYYVSVAYASNYIYALGGHNGENQGRLDTAERYNLDENLWQPIASMNRVRSDAAAAELNSRVYVAGGFEGRRYHDSAEYYDSEANQWTLISRMHSPRGGISLASHGGYLYAIGGNDGSARLRSIERYDPMSGKWEIVGQMNKRKSNLSSAVLGDDIYIIGGWSDEPEAGILNIVERFDTNTRECIEVRPLTFPASATCACTLKNRNLVSKYVDPQTSRYQAWTTADEVNPVHSTDTVAIISNPSLPESNNNINHDSMSVASDSTLFEANINRNSSTNNLFYDNMQLDSEDSRFEHSNEYLLSDFDGDGNYPAPYEKERLDQELKLIGQYGLRNKREVWRVKLSLAQIRKNARELLTLEESNLRRQFEGNALLRRLVRMGILPEDKMKLDFVLGLKIEDFLERRLQTIVYKMGLARSIHHARVLIRQRHIRVRKQLVDCPSFMVRLDSQKHIDVSLKNAGKLGRCARKKAKNGGEEKEEADE